MRAGILSGFGTPGRKTRFGKYGRRRRTYLRKHKKAYYTMLLFEGNLVVHPNEIDDAVNTQIELIAKQTAKPQAVSEALKAPDQLVWLGTMNIIHSAAEEIV